VPIPTENAYWKGATWQNESYWKTYVLFTDGDTLVNGYTYTKLLEKRLIYPWHFQGIHHSTPSFSEIYAGCFRNDELNKQAFFIRPNDSIEILWYDFNMEIGDTIVNYGIFSKVILDIDSVMLDGIYRKRLVIDSCSWPEPNYYIEGLGSTYGLISQGFCSFEAGEELHCVSVQGNIIYHNSFDSTCAIINSVQNSFPLSASTKVYPNPTRNSISIVFESNQGQDHTLSIYDVFGKKVYEKEQYLNREPISIIGFQKGLYFFKLENESKTKMYPGKFLKL
jgi:hypothetical protein